MRAHAIWTFLSLGVGIVLAILGESIKEHEGAFWLAAVACFVVALIVGIWPYLFRKSRTSATAGDITKGAEPDKMPLIELREMAAEAGWITDIRTSNDTFHLVNKLNQAASDGVINFWGRKYQDRYLAEGAKESIPLDEIPVKHFKDLYLFDIFSIFGDDATNFYIHTGKLGKQMRDQVGEIYCDIHADRQQLMNWISRNKKTAGASRFGKKANS
jgi:hypothetical protein